VGKLHQARSWLAAMVAPKQRIAVVEVKAAPDIPSPQAPTTTFQRLYGGAQINRLTSDWMATNTSADSEIRTSLRTLRFRTRQLIRDNDYAKNAVRTIKNNVVGKGMSFQSQVMKRRGNSLDEPINQAIEKEWLRWKKKGTCHTGGTLSLDEMQRMVIGAVAESGEVLVRMIRQRFGKGKIAFALEIIEADQLVDEWSGRAENGNEIRMGVEVDQWQRPVAYWLYPSHPGDYQFMGQPQTNRLIRVPAEDCLHLGLPDRPGQSRFVPWFHTALKRLNNMGGYEEAEIIAARATAGVMGFIRSPEGTDPMIADDTEDGESVYDFEPGTIKTLQAGEEFQGFNPTRPNANMDPFMRLMLRGVGAGVGLSYESLSRDYSQSNYSSSRLALLDDRDNWRVLQQWMVDNFLQPVYEAWLEMAVLSGVLRLPAYETDPELYNDVRWMPRGWEWIDPMKEVSAAILAVRAGFTTNQEVIAQKGGDYEDVFKQRRRELDLAAQYDLVLGTDPAQVNGKGDAQVVPPPEETDTGSDSSGQPAKEEEVPANDDTISAE
jgi:lambda family phage portal protein